MSWKKLKSFELKTVVANIIIKSGQWPKSHIFSPLMLLVLKIQIGTVLGYHHHRWLQGNLLEGTGNKNMKVHCDEKKTRIRTISLD